MKPVFYSSSANKSLNKQEDWGFFYSLNARKSGRRYGGPGLAQQGRTYCAGYGANVPPLSIWATD